jgi:hypothetical protein
MNEYAKFALFLGKLKQDPKASLEMLKQRENSVAQSLQTMKDLKQELAKYDLKSHQDIQESFTKLLPDLINLIEASANHTIGSAAQAFIEKHKTKSEIQQGLVTAYTAAWSEKYAFRKPEEPSGLIIGHNSLSKRDPENEKSYKELVNIFQEVHQALSEASLTMKDVFSYTHGKVGTSYDFKSGQKMTPKLKTAQQKLNDTLEKLKNQSETIQFKTNQINEIKIPGINNLGELSLITLKETLNKIQKELKDFDKLNNI